MVYWKFCSEITFLLSQVHHNEYQKFSEEVFLLPLYLLSCLPAPGKWSEWAVWPGSWGRLWEEACCSDFRHHLSQTQWLPSVGCRALSRPLVETKKSFYHKKDKWKSLWVFGHMYTRYVHIWDITYSNF